MLVVKAADHLVSVISQEHRPGRRGGRQLTTVTLAGDALRRAGQARRDDAIRETAARPPKLGDAEYSAQPVGVPELCTCFEMAPAPTPVRGQLC